MAATVKENARDIEINRKEIKAVKMEQDAMKNQITEDRIEYAKFQADVQNGLKDISTIKKAIMFVAGSILLSLIYAVLEGSNVLSFIMFMY